jgi:molybdate transport system ATP-binding protein
MADALSPVLSLDIERRFAGGPTVAASLEVALGGGSVLILFGPSGAGKTTVLRALAGLEHPSRGRIRFGEDMWFDADRATALPPQARRVGCVFQDAALFPHLTVRGNVEYGLHGLDRDTRRGRSDEMLALVEIPELADRHPSEISGGQARRVALARALAPRPRLLLLDEPFAALDQPAQARLRRLLRSALGALGIPCVLVTHDRTEAIAIGDHMAVLADGRVRQVGKVLDVFRRPADLVVAQSVGVESVLPARVGRVEGGLMDLAVGRVTLRAVATDLESERGDVYACIRAEDVTLERASPTGVSARNHLPGRVVSIDPEGVVERVTIDCGFPLTALITSHAREEMGLAPGVIVMAAIKATAIHVVAKA